MMNLQKKSIGLLIVTIILTLNMGVSVFASDISVTIDGVVQSYDQPPIIENSRTLVPLRGIFEALGSQIVWDQSTSTVTATKGKSVVIIQIDSVTASVNGVEKTLDQPAKIVSGRTMVPVRFVSEALGATIEWNAATQTVIIKSAVDTKEPTKEPTTEIKSGVELLQNADFEEEIDLFSETGWISYGAGIIMTSDEQAHSGKYSAKVYNRARWWEGIGQNLTAQLKKNGTGTYQIEGWIRTGAESPNVNIKLKIVDASGKNVYIAKTQANSSSWQKASATVDVTWTGELTEAFLLVETQEGDLQNFYIDDLSVKKVEK